MKIHSDFTDYYDHVRAFGVDPALRYVRKERRFYPSEVKGLPADWLERARWGKRELCDKTLVRFIVGFCGTLYLCTKVGNESVYRRDRLAELFPINPQWHKSHYARRAIRNLLDQMEPRTGFDAIFIQVDAPLFTVEYDYPDNKHGELWLETNISLKERDFAKVKDPFTAFQEISAYLGNQLVKRDQPDSIADEHRIAMHGFDKHSFRHPTRVSDL